LEMCFIFVCSLHGRDGKYEIGIVRREDSFSRGWKRWIGNYLTTVIKQSDGQNSLTPRINVVPPTMPPISKYKIKRRTWCTHTSS
jgi:hypothetical protein